MSSFRRFVVVVTVCGLDKFKLSPCDVITLDWIRALIVFMLDPDVGVFD